MRELSDLERLNIELLVRLDVPFGLLEQTQTTLEKAYSDATQEFREFLAVASIHNYSSQLQGQEAKVLKEATVIDHLSLIPSEVAFYRPTTKKGDPRIRISKIKQICQSGDIAVAFLVDDHLYIRRLDQSDYEADLDYPGPMRDVLGRLAKRRLSVSSELLQLMRGIAERGFIKTHRSGDTAVGHLLETELGIEANSSRAPDFKGIEIKSTRARTQSRHTMFAKVPDWRISAPSSTAQFLSLFGYERRGFLELNCTVSAARTNSQGLRLQTTSDDSMLEEFCETHYPCFHLRWPLESLRTALKRKHPETFWVRASSEKRSDGEYIRFESILHTSRPVLQQVAPLLKSGAITIDHLISDRPGRGVKEQGPLFKVSSQDFGLLFPTIDVYPLQHMDLVRG